MIVRLNLTDDIITFVVPDSQAVAFERVCALPPAVVSELCSAGLALLSCGHDAARKNAALFLSCGVHFRALLSAFDAQVHVVL